MKLLEFSNYEVKPTAEALLVKPIRKIYNSDRSKNKEKFMQQMSYLFFMEDPRSTYAYITDPEERKNQIIIQEGLEKNFKPSKDLQEAIEAYKEHTMTSSSRLLESTRIAVDAISEDLRNTKQKLAERTDKGAAVTKINDVMATLDRALAFIPKLQDLEKKVEAEIRENTRARGVENAMFEDGL